jgi:nucleoside-diphosphate-sugar epimerase
VDLKGKKVAVTGATGFIGRYIVRALLGRGAHVIGVVRNPAKVPALAAMGVELRKADLADHGSLVHGFAGASAVISNAAVVSLGRTTRDELIRHNLEGTRNVFRAMAEAGVKRAIQTSSAVVYRPKKAHFYEEGDPLRAATDPEMPLSQYPVSKACAEREAWELSDRHGIALSTVRPQSVHGAFDNGSFTLWFKRLLSLPITVYPTHMRLPSVYAGDIAEAMCLMLEHEVSEGRAYNITGDPDANSYWDLLEAYRAAGGEVPKVILPLPVPVRRRYSIERAKRDLGFRNRPLVEGFREMLELERAGA